MAQFILPEHIEALFDPSAYPHAARPVTLIQTHISYVFLAGEFVYKVKKPVRFPFVDFSTPAKRRAACRQEVVLNRPLCAETYLGVSRITEDHGQYRIDGRGRVVDYAVRMRRLPADRMMDRLIAGPQSNSAGDDHSTLAARVADRLVAFHAQSETTPRIAAAGDRAMRRFWAANFDEWAPFIGQTISAKQDRIIRAFGEAFFVRNQDLLRRRVDEMRIRDCHGDLRSDAVCFVNAEHVCIFDRLEFSRRLRYTDVAADVGFLAMDLDYRDRPKLSEAFVARYVERSGDRELLQVINFYKCYRACVRGKVESLRSAEPEVPAMERRAAARAARRYFALACRYAAQTPPALLIATCGLSASGKSSLARRLASVWGLEAHSSDVVRKRLTGRALDEHQAEGFGEGIYGPDVTERTYQSLFEAAQRSLLAGRSVVLDASFAQRRHRAEAYRIAQSAGAQFLLITCRTSDAVAQTRLRDRLREGRDPSDARWEIYLEQKERFEPVDELPPDRHLVIDTEQPATDQVRAVRARLTEWGLRGRR